MSTLSDQCRRKAVDQGLARLMNDAKWRELCFAFHAFEPKPAWRTLDLMNSHLSDWDLEWFHHVGPDYCSIEWLEIDPKFCDKEKIRSVLSGLGAPFEEFPDLFRVYGYKK